MIAFRWRLVIYVGLLLAPILIGIQAYKGVKDLSAGIDSASDLTLGGDDSVRMEVEYYRMRDALERFVAGDPKIDADEVMTRFDIVWSRAHGISTAPNFHQFSTESGIVTHAKALLRVLQMIEPNVEALERGRFDELNDMRAILEGFEQDLAASSISFAIRRQERGVEIREDLGGLLDNISKLGLVITAMILGIVASFVFEAVYARRAEANVRRREERARFLAHHDALTGLANRTRLAQAIEKALGEIRRKSANFYLLALDLDGFKGVNDTYGHHTGDELLQIVANRLLKIFRGDDLVARLGGDEFAVIIRQCPGAETVAEIASRTIAAIEQPVIIDNNTIHVSTSIGIAESPKDGATLQDVLRCADVALYEAKAGGRRAFCFFATEMDEMLLHRRRLESGLRQTMESQSLELHFQPQVDLESGHIFGVEALVRWVDPALGQVAPDTFLEIASQTGLIFDLGSWVMEKACRSAVSWAERGLTLQLAINVSPKQLYHHDFLVILDSILMRTGFPARHLTLEITEDAMVGNDDAALETLVSLRRRGVTLAIDDFGTGYSNLGYLKRLPITYLKIDRTFVKDIESDVSDRAIITGIINLAGSLGLKTIAEGVETEEQRTFLLESNCKMAQGFLFQPPLSEPQLLSLIGHGEAMRIASARRQDHRSLMKPAI